MNCLLRWTQGHFPSARNDCNEDQCKELLDTKVWFQSQNLMCDDLSHFPVDREVHTDPILEAQRLL